MQTELQKQRQRYKRKSSLRLDYGLTLEEYEKVKVFQNGRCAICHRLFKRANTDHDHGTGETRGILCWFCNDAVGKFRDDPVLMQRGIDYLKTPPVLLALGVRKFGLPGRITTSRARRRMLAKKNLQAGKVPADAYAVAAPDLKP